MEAPQISDVLKALNHSTRRDILIFLAERGKETAFSEIMEILEFSNSASGQFSYHLKLLIGSELIEKSSENKYLVTELGKKAYSLMTMVNTEENETIGYKIIFSFKNLSPREQIIVSFLGCAIIFFTTTTSYIFQYNLTDSLLINFVIILILSTIFLVGISFYSYQKLQYIPSILVIGSIMWVVLIPENRLLIGWVYIGSALGVTLAMQAYANNIILGVDTILEFIGGIVLLVSVLVVAGIVLYNESVEKKIE